MSWRLRVGFEVHARILSSSKLFSGSSSSFSPHLSHANAHVSLFDSGMPGALPRINEQCVDQAVRLGLALGGRVQLRSVFERKHYFYFDSPLGFQITQQRSPIVQGGEIKVRYASKQKREMAQRKGSQQQQQQQQQEEQQELKRVRISRIQLEQDTGKSLSGHDGANLVDLNRAGCGLMEIVTEPDVDCPLEAGAFCETVRKMLETTKTCDGNMQDGSLRFDVNISVHSDTVDSHRVEVKNLNSIRSVERAVEYEKQRLEALYSAAEAGAEDQFGHETRSFDVQTGETVPMRKKEKTTDYRFFPEPDLPPLLIDANRVERIRASMPELPEEILARLTAEPYSLSEEDALVIFGEPQCLDYFNEALVGLNPDIPAKNVANWIINVLLGMLRPTGTTLRESVSPKFISKIAEMEFEGTISTRSGKMVLENALKSLQLDGTYLSPETIVEANNWRQIQDRIVLREMCKSVVEELGKNGKGKARLAAYFDGKVALFDFFFGHVMRKAEGRANPQVLQDELRKALEEFKQIFQK